MPCMRDMFCCWQNLALQLGVHRVAEILSHKEQQSIHTRLLSIPLQCHDMHKACSPGDAARVGLVF